MELQIAKAQMPTQTQYSPNQVALGQQVRRLSLAGNPSFPIPDAFIIDYIQVIEEQAPDITPSILQKIVNMMLTGKLPYDVNKGIRNVFEGYDKYKEQRVVFDVFNVITGEATKAHEDSKNEKADKSEWFVFDSYTLGGETEKTIMGERLGFKPLPWRTVRERRSYLERCAERNITPTPFAQWHKEHEQS